MDALSVHGDSGRDEDGESTTDTDEFDIADPGRETGENGPVGRRSRLTLTGVIEAVLHT